MNKALWTRNYTTLIIATVMASAGGMAASFALSFLVYEETASTFAAAITLSMKVIPGLVVPLFIAPIMDRLPRKPFLVGCDFVSGFVSVGAGMWLAKNEFSYSLYLVFSLILATLGSFDELSYDAFYPKLIEDGMEEKGYAVSSLLYPIITALVMPLSAVLYKSIGVANILIIQGGLDILASFIENTIKIKETVHKDAHFSLRQWWQDTIETLKYYKKEKGLSAMTVYSVISSGTFEGYRSILVAFFSSVQGFTMAMYSVFTIMEMIGRMIGGALVYKIKIPREKKYGYTLLVYLTYDVMDVVLLWISYPLMLLNRMFCGFLGVQSATIRTAAVQKYIPESMRARFTAVQSMFYQIAAVPVGLFIGYLGDIMDYRLAMTIGGILCVFACLLTNIKYRSAVEAIYLTEGRNDN